MSSFSQVREADWSALLRIAGEVSEHPADAAIRRRFILDRVCDLLNASGGVVFNVADDSSDCVAVPGSLVAARMPDEQCQVLHRYITSPSSRTDVFNTHAIPALLANPVCPRRSFLEDRAWYRCENFEQTMRPWGFDDRIHGILKLPGGVMASMSLVREKNQAPFSERDCQVLALFNTHVGSLYHVAASPEMAAIEALPPRLRPVLRHLLDGDAEKQVALKLGLSRHTIHSYSKDLYRRFDVNSRGELLARFRRG